ncbi:hypothetical protein PIB30_066614 [Stylosanthes scabra]|uniref:RNase H type-1 domain-containing protein n=1 Tax=Stylosanthes scabra TaxID=79078 RepID=A0ABU6RMQ6_9FABA|nr:hypothetical protein [Stylosanthes scabra]
MASFCCRRGFVSSDSCTRCHSAVETSLHCLRDCPFARDIWSKMGFTPSPLNMQQLDCSRYRNNAIFNQHDPWAPANITFDWIPPAASAVKLNCDASTISASSVLGDELLAIWKDLLLEWEAGYKEIICETDCHETYILLKDHNIPFCSAESILILRIQEILLRPWRVELALIQRTANQVADALAKHAIKQRLVYVEWLLPWDDVQHNIDLDMKT